MISSISPKELKKLIDTAPDTIDIVDVRGTGEFRELRIPSARNLPLHLLPLKMNELDKSKKIIFVCRSGGRSAQATMFAEREGIHGLNLDGGMNEFENEFPEHVVREEVKKLFGLF
jgi:rhodanese-related sulfurtransferase